MTGMIVIFLIGFAFGTVLVSAVRSVRVSSGDVKHGFSKRSMPDLDIDEDLLSGGRTDNSVEAFKGQSAGREKR